MSVVDDAYARYAQLKMILDRGMDEALRKPVSQQNRDAGLIADTDRADVARTKLISEFHNIRSRADCLGFLDLCASFEDAFRRRVATAIGEVRKSVREHYKMTLLRPLGERLVRDARSFDSLAAIFLAIDGLVSSQMHAELGIVREERNRLAHGTNLEQPLKITVERTRELLNELIDAIW